MHFRRFLLLCAALATLLPATVPAQLTIEIAGSGSNLIPVAIASFEGESVLERSLTDIVRADLERSGLFRRIETGPLPISDKASVDFANWSTRGADALLTGSVTRNPNGRIEAAFRLWDVTKQASLAGFVFSFPPSDYRAAAHRIADEVYERLTGEKGVFFTRIAYVEKTGSQYALVIADSDGLNRITTVRSNEPLISPTWSPDGSRIAYVGFQLKKPVLYILHLATGRVQVLANYRGSNSAPAWAPDGKQLAIVLTKDGLSQIYLINADGSGLRRLTESSTSINTEPVFSPDGQSIYFTSDRGSSPQTYRIPVQGGEAQRVTFSGTYNVSPHISPNGKLLSYVTRGDLGFQVAVMDLATQQAQVLTDTALDESPHFAPNGRYILYATEVGGRGVLSVVSTDGRTKYRLSQPASDVREPAWGPYLK